MANHLFDTHFHLDLSEPFLDVIKEIDDYQIYTIAVTNLPILYTKLKNRINSKFIRPALGFHPELLNEYQKYIPEMWKLLDDTKYIGEVGLDFKIGKDSKQLQISFFEELIERCNKMGGKILTVHSRMSAADVVSVIGSNFNGKVIMHWYSGNKSTLSRALENGCYFSVNYAMLNSNSGKDIVNAIPVERLLLESDGPFIKLNKKPCTPNDVGQIVNGLSHLLSIEKEQLSKLLWDNFKKILSE